MNNYFLKFIYNFKVLDFFKFKLYKNNFIQNKFRKMNKMN
jgi:hypothetical protein